MNRPNKNYMTISEVSVYLKLPEESVYKYARTGKMPASKVGRHWRFERSVVDAWIANNLNCKVTVEVLVVDDEPMVRDLLSIWLEELECVVETASDGVEALSKISTKKYDLVLLDLMMPSMNGVDVLEQIQGVAPLTPVAIVTAHFESKLMEKALAFGPLTVLKKPILKESLAQLVANYAATISQGNT